MTRTPAEQAAAAEALRNIIENSVPTTSMWMDAKTRQRFDWIEQTATAALAAITAEGCTTCDARKHCHVCGDQTFLACSDCAINFGASVYVCSKPACRDEHERKCYGSKP